MRTGSTPSRGNRAIRDEAAQAALASETRSRAQAEQVDVQPEAPGAHANAGEAGPSGTAAGVRRRGVHPLQRAAARPQMDEDPARRLAMLGNTYVTIYELLKGQDRPRLEIAERMLAVSDRVLSEASALNRNQRRRVMNDDGLAQLHYDRFKFRDTIYHEERLGQQYTEKLGAMAMAKSLSGSKEGNEKLSELIGLADKLFEVNRANVDDLRLAMRSTEVASKAPEIEKDMRSQQMRSIIVKMMPVFGLNASIEQQPHLQSLIDQANPALAQHREQLNVVAGGMVSVSHGQELEAWVDRMGPVLDDTSTVLVDFAAEAINTEPRISNDEDPMARANLVEANQWLHDIAPQCMALADAIVDLRQDQTATDTAPRLPARSTGRSASAARAIPTIREGLVAVRGPDGLNIPARIQSDGSARSTGPEQLQYEQVNGQFRLKHDPDLDTDNLIDRMASGALLDDTPSKQASRALNVGQRLLANDPSKDLATWKAVERTFNPTTIAHRYDSMAQTWHAKSEKMQQVAARLVDMSKTPGLDPSLKQQQETLAGQLNKQAAEVNAQFESLLGDAKYRSLIKGYERPQATQWETLFDAKEIASVSGVKALPSDKNNTVFEVCIRPKDDGFGTAYPPVWLHLHAKNPMTLASVKKSNAKDFSAVHLKSDLEKNRGKNWLNTQLSSGQHDARIHRSDVGAGLLQKVMRMSKGT